MDRCPVELITKIATYACIDGGYTGRSLSLVCRYMRDAVQPVRFHTVALVGRQSVVSFAALLATWEMQPPVYHLLISALGEPYINCSKEQGALSRLSPSELSHMRSSYAKILAWASPTVATLVIHHNSSLEGELFDAEDIVFPALTNLSVPTIPLAPAKGDDTSGTRRRFPVLRRLHISHHAPGLASTATFWSHLASWASESLEHLRLSGVSQNNDLPRFLRVFLDVPVLIAAPVGQEPRLRELGEEEYTPESEEAAAAAELASRLGDLRHIYVQPRITTQFDWSGQSRVRDMEMKAGLRRIACATGGGRGRGELWLLPDSGGYALGEARKDWLDLVLGGDGPWRSGIQHSQAHTAKLDSSLASLSLS